MCEYAEKEKMPSAPKPTDKKNAPLRPLSVAAPGNVPNRSSLSRSFADGIFHLKPITVSPKLTLYGTLISSNLRQPPKDLVEQLMQIVRTAAAALIVTPDQMTTLQNGLKLATKPVSRAESDAQDTQELLTILFDKMISAGIPLEPAFVQGIKQECKRYAQNPNVAQGDTHDIVPIFLRQWNTLNSNSGSNFDMNHSVPTDYLYENINTVVEKLLSSKDKVSTTNDPNEKIKRTRAAGLVCTQVIGSLTAEQLYQILLELNAIYSPQDKHPYRQGFRYQHAQIGQGNTQISTTYAMNVESSVALVIEQIIRNLQPCERQLNEGKPLTDEMLKTVIATSAMAYQLLISIHPFADGNGRTCRMFANYILMRYHLLPATFSQESAKQSMYDTGNKLEESNTIFPQKARAAMVDALAASYDRLHTQSQAATPPVETS